MRAVPLALVLFAATPLAGAAWTNHVDILLPQAGYDLDEGWVDLWAHQCPVLTVGGSQPCTRVHVAYVALPDAPDAPGLPTLP